MPRASWCRRRSSAVFSQLVEIDLHTHFAAKLAQAVVPAARRDQLQSAPDGLGDSFAGLALRFLEQVGGDVDRNLTNGSHGWSIPALMPYTFTVSPQRRAAGGGIRWCVACS